MIGLGVFPSCLAIALPVFLYNLVLEKETKLLQTMKINGMKNLYLIRSKYVIKLLIFLMKRLKLFVKNLLKRIKLILVHILNFKYNVFIWMMKY